MDHLGPHGHRGLPGHQQVLCCSLVTAPGPGQTVRGQTDGRDEGARRPPLLLPTPHPTHTAAASVQPMTNEWLGHPRSSEARGRRRGHVVLVGPALWPEDAHRCVHRESQTARRTLIGPEAAAGEGRGWRPTRASPVCVACPGQGSTHRMASGRPPSPPAHMTAFG